MDPILVVSVPRGGCRSLTSISRSFFLSLGSWRISKVIVTIVSVARVPISIEGGDRIRGNVEKDYRTMNIGGEVPSMTRLPHACLRLPAL